MGDIQEILLVCIAFFPFSQRTWTVHRPTQGVAKTAQRKHTQVHLVSIKAARKGRGCQFRTVFKPVKTSLMNKMSGSDKFLRRLKTDFCFLLIAVQNCWRQNLLSDSREKPSKLASELCTFIDTTAQLPNAFTFLTIEKKATEVERLTTCAKGAALCFWKRTQVEMHSAQTCCR